MTRSFLRMNGCGNAFWVVDARKQAFAPSPDQVRRWANAGDAGPGFDQLIALTPSETSAVLMKVWNADGSQVETCGNALRCVGAVLLGESGSETVTIDTLGGSTLARRAPGGQITVDMGRPRLDWQDIPLAEEMDTRGIELQVGPIDAPVLHTPGAVSMGNPHVVFFPDFTPDDGLVRGTGSLIEHHPLFPEGVNVGFAHVLAPDHIRLRVWERGAGLTQACGTGACAALVATARRRLTDRRARLELDGGTLIIDWREDDDHVLMTGPVALEGSGQLPD
jgi:diaminopimelate epimerase